MNMGTAITGSVFIFWPLEKDLNCASPKRSLFCVQHCVDKEVKKCRSLYLLIRYAPMHILQVAADVVHSGVAQKNSGKVLLTDGSHAFRIGKELNLKDFCLQVVHESVERRRCRCSAEWTCHH